MSHFSLPFQIIIKTMSDTVGGSEVHAVHRFMFGLQLKKKSENFLNSRKRASELISY